ncbi:hypothetical protein BaRGS_00019517 [Batillaria attramentaria]|uniref:Ribosome biogenesis protein NSA2 homolog n=1 Tax=Batillaria attramentaria TaxID=370345 RepID=A0ABD0KRA8_9CAEN
MAKSWTANRTAIVLAQRVCCYNKRGNEIRLAGPRALLDYVYWRHRGISHWVWSWLSGRSVAAATKIGVCLGRETPFLISRLLRQFVVGLLTGRTREWTEWAALQVSRRSRVSVKMASRDHSAEFSVVRRVTGLCSLFVCFLVVITSIPEVNAARDAQIATQHLNITFDMGKDATLTCTVRNIGKKRVIWRRLSDPFPISVGARRFASTSKYRVKRDGDDWRLTIRNIRVNDAGEYECRLSGPEDVADVMSLIIPGAGETYIKPTETTIMASLGDTVVLPCHVEKIRKHLVLWQSEDRHVVSLRKKVYIGDRRMRVQHGSREEWSLRISRVEEKDFGVYTCVVNTDPPLTRSVTLRRLGSDKEPETGESTGDNPALILDNFRDQVDVQQGHTVTLECQFTGNPKPTIRWSRRVWKNGVKVTEDLEVEGERYLLTNAQPSDTGIYICSATNGVPPPAAGKIRVKIIVAPRAYALEDVVYQRRGRDAELACKGIGVPRPRVNWLLNGNTINNNYKHQLINREDRHHTTHSTLKVRSVSRSDFGKYECFVYNRYGDDTTTITLAVLKRIAEKNSLTPSSTRCTTEQEANIILEIPAFLSKALGACSEWSHCFRESDCTQSVQSDRGRASFAGAGRSPVAADECHSPIPPSPSVLPVVWRIDDRCCPRCGRGLMTGLQTSVSHDKGLLPVMGSWPVTEDWRPQNEHIELHRKRHGRRLDYEERKRKKEARQPHEMAKTARKLRGIKAKLHNKKRHAEKIQMKKTIKMHEEKKTKQKAEEEAPQGAVPAYLLDRETQRRAKSLSNLIKQKRKEKAGKWEVPLPKVKAMSEAEVFKVVKTGKTKRKAWKRMVTKVTYVGEGFTRKPAKFERFIRPMALRFKKAHVTHPELKATFQLPIIGVKKNPSSPMYTSLGVITKGTVIEVNISEIGLVTQGGKVVWGKYAQVTNNPENDGCINAVLLV